MLSSIPTPVLAILAIVIGILIGLLVSSLFSREPKTIAENPIPEKLVKGGYSEVARILYTPAAKRVVTFLDGDYYDDFATLTPDQKKRVLRYIDSWTEWGGVKPQAQPEAPAGAVSAMTGAAVIADAAPKVDLKMPPLPKADDLLAPPAKPETLEDLGIEVPTIVEPIPAVVKLDLGKPQKILEKPKSIVEQINDKLNDVIAETPGAKQGISLEDDGHHGVIVWVGIQRYEGVDAVPDPEVQKLIKEAVDRWEKSAQK
jgi:hypothetical protein